jgi:hypothetical protein
MSTFADYSTTAASNNSASPDGAPEGMAPSGVNDTMREFMARAKSNYASVDAYFSAGGTADAITGTPANVGAYAAGQTFRFKATATNTTTTPTVNINSLGAKTIQKNGGALAAGDITNGRMYDIRYDGTYFQMTNPPAFGVQTIFVPVGAMTARSTNGAASGITELSTNKIMRTSFDFDASTIEYIQFRIVMPKSWNEGTFTARFSWTAASGSGDVIWGIQAVATSDDDAMDAAFGTAQTVTDTLLSANDQHLTSATSAVTIAGTPAAEDLVTFQVYRNAAAGGDTLAVDALLMGVTLYITTDTETDA